MRTLRVYTLNNFAMYHTAVLTIVNILYFTSLVLTYHIARSKYIYTFILPIILMDPHHHAFILSMRLLKLRGVHQFAHKQIPHKLWPISLGPRSSTQPPVHSTIVSVPFQSCLKERSKTGPSSNWVGLFSLVTFSPAAVTHHCWV